MTVTLKTELKLPITVTDMLSVIISANLQERIHISLRLCACMIRNYLQNICMHHLLRLLPKSEKEIVDIDDKIKLEYANLKETHTGAIILDEKQVTYIPGDVKGAKNPNKKKDTLESIIEKVNERFDGDFTESDRVIIEGIRIAAEKIHCGFSYKENKDKRG